MPFENLPYTNFHELNSDWMIERLNDLNQYVIQAQEYAEAAAGSAEQAAASVPEAGEQAAAAAASAQEAADSAAEAAQTAADLSDEIESIIEAVQAVEPRIINRYRGKNLIAFGDSNMVSSYMTTKVYDLIADALEMASATNHSQNGASFIDYGDTQIISEIQSAAADPDCALIVCVAGINDLHYAVYNIANFAAHIQAAIDAMRAKYPDATIVMGFDTGKQLPNETCLSYQQAFAKVCQGYNGSGNIICVPTADMCLDESLFYNQNHWNEAGARTFASRAVTMLAGGVPELVPFKISYEFFDENNPTPYGHYNCGYRVTHMIDPYSFKKHDAIQVFIQSGFDTNSSDDQVGWLMRIPASFNATDSNIMGDTSDAILMRMVFGNWVRQSSGVETNGPLAFYYDTYNMNQVTGDPHIILKLRYTQDKSYFRTHHNILYFDLYTGPRLT